MYTNAWDFLRKNHQWFLLLVIISLFVGSLLVFSASYGNTAETTLETQQKVVLVEVDGVELEVNTSGEIVEDVIKELGIFIGTDDIVQPTIETPLEYVNSIEVLRVTKEIITETETLAVEIAYEERKDLEVGKELVIDQGQEGIVERTVEILYVNGEEIQRNVLAEEVQQQPKTRVVALGVQDIITKEGVTFSFTKVLDNAELTAYAAGFEHTGKNPGDYWYGMTFTGTEVQEGRTVAVDPKVIPLGWWMYIEGYGFRRAEDTGSAVKNKRVDIYFDDNDFVHKFGLKRGVKIWVIGPNDPRQ